MFHLFFFLILSISTNKKVDIDENSSEESSLLANDISSIADSSSNEIESSSVNNEPIPNESSSINDAILSSDETNSVDNNEDSSEVNNNPLPNDSSSVINDASSLDESLSANIGASLTDNAEESIDGSSSIDDSVPPSDESSSDNNVPVLSPVDSSSIDDSVPSSDESSSDSNVPVLPPVDSSSINDIVPSSDEYSSANIDKSLSDELSSSINDSVPDDSSSTINDESLLSSDNPLLPNDSSSIIDDYNSISESSTHDSPSIDESSSINNSSTDESSTNIDTQSLVESSINSIPFSEELLPSDELSSNETINETILPTESPPPIDIDNPFKDNQEIDLTNSSNETIAKDIQNAFNNSENWNATGEYDQVVKLPKEVTNFTLNLNMSENQFIAPVAGTKITVEEGNLNLILPEDDDNNAPVTVVLDTSKNVNLSIKGGGSLTIEPNNKELKNVTIISTSQINAPLNIHVDGDVNSITFSSLNLHNSDKNLSIQATNEKGDPIHVIISELDVQPYTSAVLKNISISEKFSVSQSATLFLSNDVRLKDAEVLFNMKSDSILHNKPILYGNLTEPPKRFVLNRNQNGKPPKNQRFNIIRGRFNCGQWRDLLSMDGTGFNKKTCSVLSDGNDNDNNGNDVDETTTAAPAMLLEEAMQELSIHNDGGKKLSGGQIAGIVIGCIAAVALIIIIVVCVVRKKKQSYNFDIESDIEDSVRL